MKLMIVLLLSITFLFGNELNLVSPDGKLTLTFSLSSAGEPYYALNYNNTQVLKAGRLGIKIKDDPGFFDNFDISEIDSTIIDESWNPVWGEEKTIRNHYKELVITLVQEKIKQRHIKIRFRLFNDGLGFRYEFPKQEALSYFIVSDEITEFCLTGDHTVFWMPGDYDSNEYPYFTTKISEINALIGQKHTEISTRSIIAENAVQTPLMIKSTEGLYINIHEAALVNYPVMHLLADKQRFILKSELTPDAVGHKAYMQTPEKTPWRTIIVSDRAEEILASRLILNLNEPLVLENTEWIKPQKYIGIWWGMHAGTNTWNYADVGNIKLADTNWEKLQPNGRHGATNEETKRYIDFASEHGFDGVLVEGWNVGWEDWFGNWKEEVFDFITPYPDFNIEELTRYAAEKGVRLIMHHETSSSVTNYVRRMQSAYEMMNIYGYETVKTGYVGRIIPRGEFHDSQWMVNHYLRAVRLTARYHIMINSHESCRPTGLHRTYPNWLACEAARGNEFNAWSEGNPPEHETILPFTRLIGGPMDYTPGIFQIKMDYYDKNKKEQVHTTLAKQLALYVTIYSPLQMAADLPENYIRFPDAFQFIKDVPVDWDETRILAAEPGDYIMIARKGKNTKNWFIGAISDENKREFKITLDYLDQDKTYLASIYMDAKNAHWEKNPMAYKISKYLVNYNDSLYIKLAEGGGAAISLTPASEEDKLNYQNYQKK
ncbi:MAG: glycoside hydrolase family 97 protein [Calditrichaeota bacterium]|nr:MAG: glycoside hydrolase family 97 protein [Calditrichota bacterium]